MAHKKWARVPLLAVAALAGLSAWAQISHRQQAEAINTLLENNPKARISSFAGLVNRIYGNIPIPAATPTESAQRFVDQYATAFGVEASDLYMDRHHDIGFGKFEVFWFAQYKHGIRVEGSGLTVLVKPGFVNAVVLASPRIRPVPAQPPKGLIGEDQATARVRSMFNHADFIEEPKLVIYGYLEEGRYAYQMKAGTHNLEVPEMFTFFIDAQTGSLLEKRSEIYYVDVNGRVDAWMTPGMLPDTSYNRPVLNPLFGARVRIIGGNSVFSGIDGLFTIPHGGTTDVTVEAALQGQWVRVVDNAGSNEVLTQVVTPPGPANFVFNASQQQYPTAQVNAFVHTTLTHDFVKAINPAYPGVDIQMVANVNLNQTCNAYYNGSINFFRAGGSCPNTCYSSVVAHEYGHHIVAVGHNNPSGAYHEGIADTTAVFLYDDHIVGRDFQGPGTMVRNVDTPDVQYPCNGGSHQCGLVIAGAFWDTLRELRQTMGHTQGMQHARFLYLNQILLSPAIDPGITIDVLTLDDNDGDLTNGSPHYQEINTGFTAHNLPAPPLQFLGFETRPVDLTFMPADRNITFNVRVYRIVNDYQFGTGKIHYRINGGAWQERPLLMLTPLPLSLFPEVAVIPAQPAGTLVEWYLSARDVQGNFVTDVNPSTPHESLTANVVTTVLQDTFDTDLGWTVENQNLTDGAWERGVPVGGGQRGDPPTGQGGSGACYLTGNRSGNSDVDGGPTILYSPTLNMGSNGIISYWWWHYNSTNDDDFIVQISNNGGSTWTTVRSIRGGAGGWVKDSFVVSKYIQPSSNMKLRVLASDNPNNSVTEAGFDTVLIRRVN